MEIISAFINHNASKVRTLSSSEEIELTTKYFETKDSNVLKQIVDHNLKLVFEIAKDYPHNKELISEGFIGLIKGIENFNPSKGYKLSTYASYWIRAYILNFIVNDAKLVKLGTTQAQRKLFFNLNKVKASLQAMGVEVTSNIIAEKLLVSEKEVVEMEIRMSGEASLDEPLPSEGEKSIGSKIDMISSDGMTPEEALASAEKEEVIKKYFALFRGSLSDSEKIVFEHRILGQENLKEVGEILDVSRERVRQLENRIMERLHRYAVIKELDKICI